MKKKVLLIFLVICLILGLTACTTNNQAENIPETELNEEQSANNDSPTVNQEESVNEALTPSIAGIKLGDPTDKVIEILGSDYIETKYEEAGHFPEKFITWEYADGFIFSIGQDSNQVLQIMATSSLAVTNLGIKVGDSAEETLNTYRAKYIEPESIHGGKLLGVFKVENGQAIIFDFNKDDGIVNPTEEIKNDENVERIILTYPAFLDDSF
jgi:hypothetical protein